MLCSYTMLACISEQTSAPLSEGEALAGDEVDVITSGDEETEELQGGQMLEEPAGEEMAGEQAPTEAGNSGSESGTEAGAEVEEAGESVADPLPPPSNLNACDRFCQRMEDCIYPRCEAINQIPPDQFCQGWCRSTGDEWLDQGADLSCEDFSRRIYGFLQNYKRFVKLIQMRTLVKVFVSLEPFVA